MKFKNLGKNNSKTFIKYIQDKVHAYLSLTADQKEKAFQLFEVLNNRGRSLEANGFIEK